MILSSHNNFEVPLGTLFMFLKGIRFKTIDTRSWVSFADN